VESLAGDTNPEQEVSRKQMNRLLVSAVSSLPEQQRQVIILKFIEGLDNREIEQIMGKKQGAIRMLQMRALTTLRQKLSGKR
jgi:RNA polymerase sigma-70 factor (ECF subfamily)